MTPPVYLWRQLSCEQREQLLDWRKQRYYPWHAPPHRPNFDRISFHITAACYEHQSFIGRTPTRMDKFAEALLNVLSTYADQTLAWCVLPNHYHALVNTANVLRLAHELGRLHGRMSFLWNGEESRRGRQVFYRAMERAMRSERHSWATLNYVHHNPVHHGYVQIWTDWPWSSTRDYLREIGKCEAERIWQDYPIQAYGKGWDAAEL